MKYHMLTIFCAIYNNYDELLPFPPQVGIDCRFVIFTDRQWFTSQRDVVIKDFEFLPPHLKSRYIKTHSHSLPFVKDGPSLRIDGNIILKRPDTIAKIIEQYTGTGIMAMKHHERSTIKEEADHLKSLGRFNNDKIDEQMEQYVAEGYDFSNGMSNSAILYRDNTPEIKAFNEMRRNNVLEYCYRDQLSMHYCAWKINIPVTYIDWKFEDNEYVGYRYHTNVLQSNKK